MKRILITILIIIISSIPIDCGAANTYSTTLNGSSQYFTITDASQTGLDLNSDFTIEAWVNLAQRSKEQIITAKIVSENNNAWLFYISGSNLLVCAYTSNGTWDASHLTDFYTNAYPTVSHLNTWTHVAVSVDISAHSMQFYVNGSAVSGTQDNVGATSIVNNAGAVTVGRADYTTPGSYLNGKLDDIRIWSDIRTPEEIAANYNKELTGNETNLVAYWKFNNNALDETSNNNDLTNVNSATFTTDLPFNDVVAPAGVNESDIIIFDL